MLIFRRSMIAFVISIMSFVWRTGTTTETEPMSPTQALVGRIVVTAFLVVGIAYFVLIIGTLQRYGDMLDDQWRQKVISIVETATNERSRVRRDSKMSSAVPQPKGAQHIDYHQPVLHPSPKIPAMDPSLPRLHSPPRSVNAAGTNWLPATNDRPMIENGVLKRSEQRFDIPTPSVRSVPVLKRDEAVSMFRLADLSIPLSSERLDTPSNDELARSGFSSEGEWATFSDVSGNVCSL